jgi:hypothetical protein
MPTLIAGVCCCSAFNDDGGAGAELGGLASFGRVIGLPEFGGAGSLQCERNPLLAMVMSARVRCSVALVAVVMLASRCVGPAPLHQTGSVECVAAVFALACCKPLADGLGAGQRCSNDLDGYMVFLIDR